MRENHDRQALSGGSVAGATRCRPLLVAQSSDVDSGWGGGMQSLCKHITGRMPEASSQQRDGRLGRRWRLHVSPPNGPTRLYGAAAADAGRLACHELSGS